MSKDCISLLPCFTSLFDLFNFVSVCVSVCVCFSYILAVFLWVLLYPFYFLSVSLSFFLCLYFIVVVYISSKYFFELQYSVKEIDAKLNDYLSKYILIYQLQHNTNRFRNIRLKNREKIYLTSKWSFFCIGCRKVWTLAAEIVYARLLDLMVAAASYTFEREKNGKQKRKKR